MKNAHARRNCWNVTQSAPAVAQDDIKNKRRYGEREREKKNHPPICCTQRPHAPARNKTASLRRVFPLRQPLVQREPHAQQAGSLFCDRAWKRKAAPIDSLSSSRNAAIVPQTTVNRPSRGTPPAGSAIDYRVPLILSASVFCIGACMSDHAAHRTVPSTITLQLLQTRNNQEWPQ